MTVRGTDLSLLEQFSALTVPRQMAKVLFPLPEILLLVPAATLAGAHDFVEVQAWGEERLAFLRRFLPFANGVPSHDTRNGVINALDPELFKRCFVTPPTPTASVPAGLEPPRAAGSTDCAPTSRSSSPSTARPRAAAMLAPRAASRCTSSPPLRRLGAGCSAVGSAKGRWASRQRLVLGQEAVAGKSNEITAIPRLLERLELAGALVTIDRSAIDPVAKRAAPRARQATPSAARPGSQRRSWPRTPTTSWR